ncbi:MAG: hypothetical protein A3K10_00650 [Bacteroidetes bacterium RIFCSPLOWO2_12_FULL_31_6]|nr:MAG: hypothetical protein A3K10_00650 [Bacteroidetes bacterium RIFCSPLOWO2_12_FULL_31_6]
MKITFLLVFVFFSIFCFGQRGPKFDSIVKYSTCSNNKVIKVTLYYFKGEISFVSQVDSVTQKTRSTKNPKNIFKPSFKCGSIIFEERYKNSSQKKLEYERDDQGIIWRKQYSSDGTLVEDYKR